MQHYSDLFFPKKHGEMEILCIIKAEKSPYCHGKFRLLVLIYFLFELHFCLDLKSDFVDLGLLLGGRT